MSACSMSRNGPKADYRAVNALQRNYYLRPALARDTSVEGNVMHLSSQGLFVIIVVGVIAGWLAGRVMEGGGFGLIGDLLVGLVGAFIGDWLVPQLGICLDHQRLHWSRCASAYPTIGRRWVRPQTPLVLNRRPVVLKVSVVGASKEPPLTPVLSLINGLGPPPPHLQTKTRLDALKTPASHPRFPSRVSLHRSPRTR